MKRREEEERELVRRALLTDVVPLKSAHRVAGEQQQTLNARVSEQAARIASLESTVDILRAEMQALNCSTRRMA
jgi:hypothetical protein